MKTGLHAVIMSKKKKRKEKYALQSVAKPTLYLRKEESDAICSIGLELLLINKQYIRTSLSTSDNSTASHQRNRLKSRNRNNAELHTCLPVRQESIELG